MLLFQEEILDGKDLDLSPVQKEFICTLRYDGINILLKSNFLRCPIFLDVF